MARGIASWFGGDDDEPKQELPAAPQYKTAQQLFDEAMGYAKTNYPQAYGARESALGDISKGNAYYESFQPTSFEQALGNRNFQDIDRIIKQSLSMSGVESSPILAEQRAKAGTDIGEFLTNLGNERARYSLNSRMGIDPNAVMSPFLNTNMGQSNLQTESDYENALIKASMDYQNALKAYNNKASGISTVSTLAGAGIGFALGGPAGASLGASLGGTASPLWGGGEAPVSMGDALSMYQMLKGTGNPQSASIPQSDYSDIRLNSGNLNPNDYWQNSYAPKQDFSYARGQADTAGVPYAYNMF